MIGDNLAYGLEDGIMFGTNAGVGTHLLRAVKGGALGFLNRRRQ